MAKTNKKNNNTKNNNPIHKKINLNNVVNKKTGKGKKKIVVPEQIKSDIVLETELVKIKADDNNPSSKMKESISTSNKNTPDIIEKRKERNRKKYQNQQKKYQDIKKNKPKKTVTVEDEVKDNKITDVNEESPVKKESKVQVKEKKRREKRKNSRKGIHFTQTLVNIKDKSVDKINLVKEKTNDKNIPVGKTKEEKKQRFRRIIKESIIYAIILTIINIICVLVFDYFNFLRLFDIKSLNVVITILISLIFNFFVAFMIDYFVTEIWLKKRRKKEDGVQDGDNRINEGEYQEDIQNKKGE